MSGLGIIMLIMFLVAISLMVCGCTDLEIVKKYLSKQKLHEQVYITSTKPASAGFLLPDYLVWKKQRNNKSLRKQGLIMSEIIDIGGEIIGYLFLIYFVSTAVYFVSFMIVIWCASSEFIGKPPKGSPDYKKEDSMPEESSCDCMMPTDNHLRLIVNLGIIGVATTTLARNLFPWV